MTSFFRAVCAIIVLVAFAFPAHAAPSPDIERAQAYLQSLKTAQARFTQTAPDGTQTTGEFYLHRPGKLRFQFDPPVTDYVVADGLFIYFYDGQLKQQSNAPIGQTLADFLLRKNLRLSGDVTVTDVRHSDRGLLLISLVQTSSPQAGTLTLGFRDDADKSGPFQLVEWRVTDASGAVTEVALSDLRANIPLDDKLFYYRAPKKPAYSTNE